MPHLPRLLAATTLVFGLALGLGQARATPLPLDSGVAPRSVAAQSSPVEKVHRRYWRWGPRYNYGYWGGRYYRPYPYYYYRPYPYYYGYRYWYGPRYRYWW